MYSNKDCLFLTLTTLALVVLLSRSSDASCAKAFPKCCQGKNNTCRVQDYSSTGEKKKDLACFCDSACLDLGDCCKDYKRVCPPIDCQLSDQWEEWGECDARCGLGVKQRIRRILVEPMNGGKSCGTNVEKMVCEGLHCKVPRAQGGLEELRETGKIIPATFGPWRKDKLYNPFEDIRKNLFQYYNKEPLVERPPYCATYEITEVRSGCNIKTEDGWSEQLTKGSTVCVECQPFAMKKRLGGRCKGHGLQGRETRWNAMTLPGCHGKWILTTKHTDCKCDVMNNKMGFIFV